MYGAVSTSLQLTLVSDWKHRLVYGPVAALLCTEYGNTTQEKSAGKTLSDDDIRKNKNKSALQTPE